MVKRLLMLSLLLGIFALPFAMLGRSVSAEPGGATDAVAACQELDEDGELDAAGVTFGECVNILKGPSSENANNQIAGLCGIDEILTITGAKNKGQCIKIVKGL